MQHLCLLSLRKVGMVKLWRVPFCRWTLFCNFIQTAAFFFPFSLAQVIPTDIHIFSDQLGELLLNEECLRSGNMWWLAPDKSLLFGGTACTNTNFSNSVTSAPQLTNVSASLNQFFCTPILIYCHDSSSHSWLWFLYNYSQFHPMTPSPNASILTASSM